MKFNTLERLEFPINFDAHKEVLSCLEISAHNLQRASMNLCACIYILIFLRTGRLYLIQAYKHS